MRRDEAVGARLIATAAADELAVRSALAAATWRAAIPPQPSSARSGLMRLERQHRLEQPGLAAIEPLEQRGRLGERRDMGDQRQQVERRLRAAARSRSPQARLGPAVLASGATPEICEQTSSTRLWWNSSPSRSPGTSPWKKPIATTREE